MDRLLDKPRNRGWRRYQTSAKLALLVVAVVFGVASIVPLGLYFMMPDAAQSPASARESAIAADDPPPETPTVIFSGVNVVNVQRGTVSPAVNVVVRNGTIAAIGADAPGAEAGATAVDSRGLYLIPGLIDTHVHLVADNDLLLFVAAGVTSVQSLGGGLRENAARNAAVESGKLVGPGVISCDYVVRGLTSSDGVLPLIDEAATAGAECVKIYSPPDWTTGAHAALIQTARARGLRIGGHLPRNLPLEEGLGHGQQFVAHAEEFLYAHFFKFPDRLNEERIAPVAEMTKKSEAIVTPTLAAYHSIVEEVGHGIDALLAKPELRYVPAEILAEWQPDQNRYRKRFTPADGERLGAAFAFQQKLVAAWWKVDVPLTVGTDASPDMPFVVAGFSALDELDELARAGLPPIDVLRAATINGATLLGRRDRIGEVTVGMRADLVLLEANPLDAVANVRRRRGVMVNGRWMPEAWLQERLERRARPSSTDAR